MRSTDESTGRFRVIRALAVAGVLVSSLALAPSALAAVNLDCRPNSVDIGETTNCTATADAARTPLNYAFTSDGNPGVSQSGSSNTASGSFSVVGNPVVRVTVTYALPDAVGELQETAQTPVAVVQPNRAPDVSAITCSPTNCNPISGQPVTLTVSAGDADNDPLTYAWTGCSSSAPSATCTFATPGNRTVSVAVSDGTVTVTRSVTVGVQNQTPTAGFTNPFFGPGQQVTLTSNSSDPDGTINRYEWDLDGDGSYERTGTARSVTTTFFVPTTVRLRVRDNSGTFSPPFVTRVVPNDTPPTPSFAYQPAPPGAGQQVTFSSTSADIEGPITNHGWDLDGNGTFETDTGAVPSASRSFPRAGSYTVSLRATDGAGQSAIATQAVTVNATAAVGAAAASASAPAVAAAATRLPLLRPFPVVRLRGTLTRNGARVRLLSVQAPRGARATVRCTGRSCGKRRSQALRARSSRSLRFTRYHRYMRAGTMLQVFVSKPGTIGKYVRFTIRKGKPPARRDSCVVATSRTPSRCPTG